MPVRVRTGSRIHLGFRNLSPPRSHVYGSIGVSLATPRITLKAAKDTEISCEDPLVRKFAKQAVDIVDVEGVSIDVLETFPRHIGLGSGTQIALSTLLSVARVWEREIDIRAAAPALGRGKRSGIGVASFERGGFIIDRGHASDANRERLASGEDNSVPAVAMRHDIPTDWRFMLLIPDLPPGRSGEEETASLRTVLTEADADIGARIRELVDDKLVPGLREGDLATFGQAMTEIDRLNGQWFVDEQDDIYRPPIGGLIERVLDSEIIVGAGQSSWGPTIYAVTAAGDAEEARVTGRNVLDQANITGDVRIVSGNNHGAEVITDNNN